jgi:acyl carrier protein
MQNQLSEEQIATIRKNYAKCTPETVEAIVRFRQSREVKEIPTIVKGIVQRYLPADKKPLIDSATEQTTMSDLKVESLTMLEIVLDIQDAVDLVIEDTELRGLRTLGDFYRFLEQKIAAAN